MDKSKFKKLALMGMAGGMVLASQTPASANASEGMTLAGGCGGRSAPRYQPQPYNTGDAPISSSGCGGSQQPAPRYNTGDAPISSSGCGGRNSGYSQQPAPRYNTGDAPLASGCGSKCGAKGFSAVTADAQDTIQQQQSQGGWPSGAQAYSQPMTTQQNQGYFQGNQSMQPMGTQQPMSAQPMNKQLSENELMQQLSNEGKATYQRLSPEGKALALRLASQNTYRDKNDAVRAAEAASKRSNSPRNGY